MGVPPKIGRLTIYGGELTGMVRSVVKAYFLQLITKFSHNFTLSFPADRLPHGSCQNARSRHQHTCNSRLRDHLPT